MQAPRNWRMKEDRYRLTGTENVEGVKSIVNRPVSLMKQTKQPEKFEKAEAVTVNAA